MRFFDALRYPFTDRDWFGKLATALLIAAIPLLGYFMIKGWEFEISVRVKHRSLNLLPGWENLGGKLMRGLLIRFAEILYNLPTYALFGFGIALWVNLLGRFFAQGVLTTDAFIALYREGFPLRAALFGLGLFYALAANILYWTGYLRYIETRQFLAFFDVIDNLRMAFRNIFDDLTTAIYVGVVTFVMGLAGTALAAALAATGVGTAIVPLLVPAITLTVLSVFKGHLFGQLAIRTLE
jgi:hypothetical protein